MVHRIRSYLLIVATLFSAFNAMARQVPADYTIQRITPDNGLSQGSNYFRHEDRKGYMWITANDAINRYDGSTVKVYNLARYFKDCPPLQQGYGFAEDEESNIYIGSVHGLYIYHRNTDKFTLKKIFTGPGNSLTMPFACKEGKIWCFNRRYEIATYTVRTQEVETVAQVPLPEIPSVHIYDVPDYGFYDRWPFMDRDQLLWFPGRRQIQVFNTKTNSFKAIPVQSCGDLYSTYYDAVNHQLLIGCSKGLQVYDIGSGLTTQLSQLGHFPLGRVSAVCCNSNTIALHCDEGMLLTDRSFQQSRWLSHSSGKFNRVYAFGTDRADRIWICDDGFGQVVYRFTPLLLPKQPVESNTPVAIRQKGVQQFLELPDGDIIAQRNMVLDHKTRQLGSFSFPVNLNRCNLMVVETDRYRKGAWILVYQGQLMKIYFLGRDLKSQLIYTTTVPDSMGICQNMKVLEDGRILLSFSGGLYWLKDKHLVAVAQQPGKHPFVISPVSKQRFAVSYLNSDMWLAQTGTGDHIRFLRRVLPGVQAFYLLEDTVTQHYWAGTNKGVYLLDAQFNTLKIFDANNGLAGTYIYGLLLDDAGNPWCSHQRGLSSIDAKTLQVINYDKSDGIQDWDYNNRACYKATDGTLYFGGVNGFNYFKPPLIPAVYYQPEVYIDEILVNNKVWLPDTNANLLQYLELRHNQNNIIVKAIVKDLMYGSSRQLIYRIRETDNTWKSLPAKGLLSFNSLAPGDYTLELGTFDKYRIKALFQKAIRISIAVPYYQSTWFWMLMTILGSGLLCWIYLRIRLNKQRTALRQKQALEQQRSKITADLHDDIGSSLSSLQINSSIAHELLNRQPEQARKVLEKITTQSRDLSGRIGDMIWSMTGGKDEFITLSSRIRNFAHDIMGDTNISYQVIIDKQADVLIQDMTQRRNLVLIAKEAINNAVKYSAATRLDIIINMDKGEVILTIADNGIGFDPSQEQKGNGLLNMSKRAEEIAGKLLVASAKGQGTKIRLIFRVLPIKAKAGHWI